MLLTSGCSDFLDSHNPQGTIDNEQLNNPEYVDNLVISAYAIWISAEDIKPHFHYTEKKVEKPSPVSPPQMGDPRGQLRPSFGGLLPIKAYTV